MRTFQFSFFLPTMPFARTTFFVFAVLLFASACADERPRPRFRIGFSQCCNDAWRDVMNSEMLRELALNRELTFEMRTADADNARQIAQIEELVALGVDLLIVAPNPNL
jgi:ABC-type sugar transport system substrate-binding protein